MNSPAFVADGYRKSFGRTQVLRAASVWAKAGKITGLLGLNGSGKSTLLRCATGLHGSAQGITKVSGTRIPRPSIWRLARQGVLYWPDRGLLSDRRSIRWHHRLPPASASAPESRLDPTSYCRSLSGGERRMAETEWVVARQPRVLLADEPLAGLEPRLQDEVMQSIRSLADSDSAVVVTGHDARRILELSDEVVWMAEGTTYALGSPARASAHHQFRREYLGPSGAL